MLLLFCNCSKWGASETMALIQIFLSVIACFIAVYIPKKIAWEQRYSQLLAEYRGHDYAAAVMALTMFFNKNCKNDVNSIEKEYIKIYKAQFKYQFGLGEKPLTSVQNDQNLHFQRRLLNQFYWDLDLCARSLYIGKKRIQKDFTSKEANMLKVLYYMNIAAESDEIFMDISTDDRLPPNPKSTNVRIKDIYEILKDSKSYVQ